MQKQSKKGHEVQASHQKCVGEAEKLDEMEGDKLECVLK